MAKMKRRTKQSDGPDMAPFVALVEAGYDEDTVADAWITVLDEFERDNPPSRRFQFKPGDVVKTRAEVFESVGAKSETEFKTAHVEAMKSSPARDRLLFAVLLRRRRRLFGDAVMVVGS